MTAAPEEGIAVGAMIDVCESALQVVVTMDVCESVEERAGETSRRQPATIVRTITVRILRPAAQQDRIGIKLSLGDCDSHVGPPLDLRFAVRETIVPVGHAGILADDKAKGP